MKKCLIFLFSIQMLFAQNSMPRLEVLQEKGVKKVTVKNHQLLSVHSQTKVVRKEEKKDPSGEVTYHYFISRTGLLDSIHTHFAGGQMGMWMFQYDEEDALIGFMEMSGSGIITKQEKLEQLASGYQRYRKWQQGELRRESTIDPNGRVIFQRYRNGRDSSIYRYDKELEVVTHQSYMHGKPNYELRYEWLVGEEGADSMFFSFKQFAPGEGRMPSHANRFKVLEDGSLEVLPHHQDSYQLKEVRFEERLPLFEGMSPRMGEAFSGDELAKKSDVIEMPEYSGWIRRYYYTYRYEFWGE